MVNPDCVVCGDSFFALEKSGNHRITCSSGCQKKLERLTTPEGVCPVCLIPMEGDKCEFCRDRAKALHELLRARFLESNPTGKKACAGCGEEKYDQGFPRDRKSSDGRTEWCRLCSKSKSDSGLKLCRDCGEWLPLDEFRSKRTPSMQSYHNCCICRNAKKLGSDKKEYLRLMVEQGGECAMCNRTESDNGARLAIDHDHDSGKIRALLCNRCNSSLGMLDDQIDGALAALQHLVWHKIGKSVEVSFS